MKKKAGIILVVLLVCLLSTVIVACENTIYYTVTFETNGGSQVQEISVNPGDSIASPTSTKEGYVLEGWYDNAEFNGEKITFPYVPNKDTKLYAKWSIESYVGTYVGLVSYVDEGYAHYIGLVPHVYEIFIMTLNEDGTGKFVGAGSDFEVGFSHYYGREFDAKYAIDGGKISIEVTKSLDFRPEVFYLNGSVKNGVITLSELSSFSNDNFTNVVFNRINSDNQAILGTYSDIVPEGLLEEGIVKLHVALDADSNVKYLYESATGEIGSDEDDTDMQYLIVGDTILLLRDSGDSISITRGQFVDGAITMYGGLWQFVFTRNLSGGTVCETGKHEFGRWIVSQSAFCVSEGVERRACKVCGIKESKTIPPTGVHSSYYSSNDEEHRYVCFHCDYVDVEKSGKHNYGNEIVDQEPTCGYMGRGYRECGVCEHRIYFDIPATGEHTCIDEYNDYRHWQFCSVCFNTINGAYHEFLDKNDSTGHWQECSGCEYVSETIPHTLDYAYDANAHWSKCEDCDYVVDKTAHTMTEKSDVNNHWTECTVCDYKSAKIVHTYENRYDKDNHWEECSGCSYVNNKKAHVLTLTNSETEHWHQCSECSYKSEIETHAFEEAYDKSNHWQQCSVCAYVKDKTAHTTLSIRHDDTYHWRGCDDCEYTEDQQAYNKYATWGKNDEEHWQHCSICSQEINRSTHGNFRITHERERGLHNELCGTCGINAGLQVDCFSNEWKASDKSHFNTCDYCNEFVKLEHVFDIFVAIGIDKCGCGEFKCNENLQYKLINDNTEYSVSYDKTAETELITLILPDYYEDPVTGEILPVTRIEDNGFTGLEISEFFISPSINFILGAAFSGSKINALFIEDMNAWCNMSYTLYGNSLLPVVDNIYYDMKYANDLKLPDGITNINYCAFQGFKGLKSVTIPDSVTKIGSYAFENCSGMTSIKIGNSVTTIGMQAFTGCSGLTSITIPNSVTTIGRRAFENCSGLTSAIIGDSVKTIDERTFYECSGLTSVIIGNSVTTIDDYAFRGCSGLTSITIPDNVNTIGDSAFENCSGMTSVKIGNSVTTIGMQAFTGCSGLTSITIPNSVTTIGYKAFSGCSGLTSITIPDSVTTISSYAFSGCSRLTNVIIGKGVKSIGNYMFQNCRGLTSISIPESVTTIGESAFSECSGLKSITIPDSVTTIGNWAFENCRELMSIIIPDSVKTIGERAFLKCSGLTSIIIGNNVTTIGGLAFYECSGLTSVVIGSGVTTIGDGAFEDCSGLTSITIPDSVTTIGNWAFSDCSGLTSITIPEGVTTIGTGAFRGCSGLTSITIPEGVTTIGTGAFRGCSGLTSITVADSNPKYHSDGNCIIETEIKTLVVGCKSSVIPSDGSVKIIGERAFSGCSGLTSITIPDSITTIGDYAFSECNGLTSVIIGNSVTTIGYEAFYSCRKLRSITVAFSNPKYHSSGNCIIETESKTLVVGCKTSVIPTDGSVTIIGSSAFSGCSGLSSITLPDSVTTIGNSAFYNCSGLTSITIPDSVTRIGEGAFTGCSGLTIFAQVSEQPSGWSYWNYSCPVVWDCDNNDIADDEYIYIVQDGIRYGIKDGNAIVVRQSENITTATISATITYNGIAYGVTTIGSGAFRNCSELESITLPFIGERKDGTGNLYFRYIFGDSTSSIPTALKTVVITSATAIGNNAFYDCSGLTSITIPDSVTTIGYYAFYNCSGLTSITIPDSVTTIGSSAFKGCSGLTSITIPDSVTTIGSSAFKGCSELESITLPFIGERKDGTGNLYFRYIFGDSTSSIPTALKTVVITSATAIGDWAFSDCSGLTSITIPESVTTIGSSAFSGCSGLESIVVAESNTNYHSNGNCLIETASKTLVVGCKMSVIPSDGSVTTISDYAFSGCSGLTSITIPDSVTTIGSYAFSGCSGLESITLPFIGATKDGIENTHFGYIFGASSAWSGGYVPTSLKTVVITSATAISDYAFYGCSGLTSIIIGNSVTTIGSVAFGNCSGLTSITIPDSVTTIGSSAFSGCSGLTSITIPDSVTEIRNYAFQDCSELESIVVAERNPKYHSNGNCIIETESKTLVVGCKTSVIPTDGSVTTIGSSAFSGCSGLTSITIPESVTTIENWAFMRCSGLESIDVAEGNTRYHSDGNCLIETASKTLILGCTTSVIPSDGSVTTIGDWAFYGRSGLTSITIPASVTTIGSDAFYNCSGLTNIIIPDSVTTIGSGAFRGCSGLTSITIPDSVTEIRNYAFQDCSGLTSIIYNGTMAEWQNISKGSGWDFGTGNYTIICTDGTLSKNN